MNDEIKQERSPNCPTIPLSDAIEQVGGLYKKAGKAKVKPVVAATAIGYTGLNGASMTALAGLRSYGLIDRERGGDIAVSADAIKILHPVDEPQKTNAIVQLALKPKVFEELFTSGFSEPDQDVLANHLVQKGFRTDRARKAAEVYCANYEFANLKTISIFPVDDTNSDKRRQVGLDKQNVRGIPADLPPDERGKKVLAKYSIPLGSNEATLVFTGEGDLTPDDFDALIEYVTLFKKQLGRRPPTPKVPGEDQ